MYVFLTKSPSYKQTGIDVNDGFNDDRINQWLGHVPVTLFKQFNIDNTDNGPYFIQTIGLDTVATLTLNQLKWNSENVHASKIIDITPALTPGFNNLTISISPPVTEAKSRSLFANQPPSCPPDIQHGQ